MTLARWYTDQDYPNRAMLIAADQATGGTHHIVDALRAVMILRGTGMNPDVLRMILDKRAAWLDWHCMTQRKWQRHTRRLSRALTGYSVPGGVEYRPDPSKLRTREYYVRCHDGEPSGPSY